MKNEWPLQEDEIRFLTKLGLSLSQGTVYLALTRLNKAVTARTISTFSKVARPDAYRILSELEKLGLIEREVSAPRKYRALSLQEGISILLERRAKESSELQRKATELLQQVKYKPAEATLQEEEPQFLMVPNKEAVVRRTIKALENAQTSMVSIISWKKFSNLMFNAREFRLKKALKRGVKLRFITEKPEDEKSLPEIVEIFKKHYFFKVRYLLVAPSVHIGLFDEKEVFINTSTASGLTETPLLWSNNPSLIALIRDYFEIAWVTAMEGSN